MALNINGRMKVKTLRADFKEEFGLTLRVYDGRSFANDDATLASIRKGDSKGGEFSPKRNTKVGNLEEKIENMFGIKTQVAGSDDSYLCDNDLTLTGALEEDEKKMGRKEKKDNKENDLVDEELNGSQEDVEVVKEFYDDLYDEDHTENFNLTFFVDEVVIDGEEYGNVIASLKKLSVEIGEELENIISNIDESKEALYDFDEDKYIGDEIQVLGIEYYDQYNDRLAHSLPVTFSSDMNGADWRSVESIKAELKKLDKNLYERWMVIWEEKYVGQDRLYEFYESLSELLEENFGVDEESTSVVSNETNSSSVELSDEEEEKKWLDELWNIYNIPQHLLSKRSFVLKVIQDNIGILEVVSDEINNDREIILSAVKNQGIALKFASDELKNDKEIVLEAIKSWGGDVLEFASDELKNDKDVVRAAIEDDEDALEYASKELREFFTNK